MTIALLFWSLMIGCCGYAALAGGWEGRWFAALYVAQSVLLVEVAIIDHRWSGTHWPTVAIDLMLLLGFYLILARTHRFWPIWVFGFHLITLSAHLASLFAAFVPMRVYFLLATMWAVPKLIVAVFGIAADRRAGLPPTRRGSRRDGPETGY